MLPFHLHCNPQVGWADPGGGFQVQRVFRGTPSVFMEQGSAPGLPAGLHGAGFCSSLNRHTELSQCCVWSFLLESSLSGVGARSGS